VKCLPSAIRVISLLVVFQSSAAESRASAAWTVKLLGPTVNTAHNERFSMISPDGLAIYFASDRPDSEGDFDDRGRKPLDMYVAWRDKVGDSFGNAVNLGPKINSPYGDHSATFSEDGHWMYFASSRPGGCGGYDLYVSHRDDINDHLGWQEPQHLGCTVNTASDEACPFFMTDEQTGISRLYLVRNSAQGENDFAIFMSPVGISATELRMASPVVELNSAIGDYHFEARHGLIWSKRAGGYGGADIWGTSFSPQTNQWTEPENMGASINTEHHETLPSSTADGMVFFPSNRPGGYGGYDIYFATPANH
jgi:hypothetical protein